MQLALTTAAGASSSLALNDGSDGKDFGVVRSNDDGSSDTGFGCGSAARVEFPGAQDHANALALDRHNTIIIAVGIQHTHSDRNFAIVRLPGTDGASAAPLLAAVSVPFDPAHTNADDYNALRFA
ncbi:MAG: hypothetical protein ABIW82_17680 [Dokdonella sp.]